jgi:hypothetical protein
LPSIANQEAPMDERRGKLRARTLKAARIAFNDRASSIDCTVRNLSDRGACLQVASPIGVPDNFDLVFEADHSRQPCRVVWRKDSRIGVTFAKDG